MCATSGCSENSLRRIDRCPKTNESMGKIQQLGLHFQRLEDGEIESMITS